MLSAAMKASTSVAYIWIDAWKSPHGALAESAQIRRDHAEARREDFALTDEQIARERRAMDQKHRLAKAGFLVIDAGSMHVHELPMLIRILIRPPQVRGSGHRDLRGSDRSSVSSFSVSGSERSCGKQLLSGANQRLEGKRDIRGAARYFVSALALPFAEELLDQPWAGARVAPPVIIEKVGEPARE